jgi:two-component system chemotaxis response regulator CheB
MLQKGIRPTRGAGARRAQSRMKRSYEHVVVIGASAGGVAALLGLAGALPPLFAAPVCIVQHIGSNVSVLPELLQHRGPNPARHARDGEPLAPGIVYVAPPDRHLLIEGDRLRLTHGAKENHARPAIDPLFRSAAASFGAAVIGVVLTGQMDDGSAGLQAVKDCGGIAIVEDPATACEPEMPRNALRSVAVDHCVALAGIGPLLARLVGAQREGAEGDRLRQRVDALRALTESAPPDVQPDSAS